MPVIERRAARALLGPAPPGGDVFVARTHLTPAQIIALETTPVIVAPARGLGTITCPILYQVVYTPGTTPYDLVDENLEFFWSLTDNNTIEQFSPVSVGMYALDQRTCGEAIPACGKCDPTWQNSPVYLQASGTGFTGGDGTLDITILYIVLNIPPLP